MKNVIGESMCLSPSRKQVVAVFVAGPMWQFKVGQDSPVMVLPWTSSHNVREGGTRGEGGRGGGGGGGGE